MFVLDDGGEVDLDLGNYERFLDISLHRDNNITTGKIYKEVIDRERQGGYLGDTVQVVPHITDCIQENVTRVAKQPVDDSDREPEVCIIELGGTIGDIESMPFVEAFRQFQFKVGLENFCSIHVSLVPQPQATGEHKTKPTQNSVKALRGEGLAPDIIVCRSENPITVKVKEKISHFCHVPPELVICMHDVPSIYRVPVELQQQGLVDFFRKRLQLKIQGPMKMLKKWRELADRYDNVHKEVKIALVGKYTSLEDAYASVVKALKHSCLHINYRLKLSLIESEDLEPKKLLENPVRYHEAWQCLCSADGIIVPGGFGERGINGKIAAIEWSRKNNKPFLGVCLGLQCAVIEFARNVLGWEDADSTEFIKEDKKDKDETKKSKETPKPIKPVVIDMPEHNDGNMGGTMRLGRRTSIFCQKESVLFKLYGCQDRVDERHRHRYEVNPDFVKDFENAGLRIVAKDETGRRMEMIDIKNHPYFVAVQFHPEYLSRPLKPSPPFLGLILAATGKLTSYLNKGLRVSPRNVNPNDESSDEELAGASSLEWPSSSTTPSIGSTTESAVDSGVV